ncbi:MAG: phosphopantothenoylcysteine decarboxylase [Candidatus Omnitrophota bacterium]
MITDKKILITAGPTWVAIDQARVISNIATGETGFLLAKRFKKLGIKVTLLLGPGQFYSPLEGIKVVNFKYFAQLKQLLTTELKDKRYLAIVHAAAVSDYQPKKINEHKLSSQLKNLKIDLVPTEKLINSFKSYNKNLFTVGFKFEPSAIEKVLLKKAANLLKKANLDLVVANSCKNSCYRAYILNEKNKIGPFLSKNEMVKTLAKIVEKKYYD